MGLARRLFEVAEGLVVGKQEQTHKKLEQLTKDNAPNDRKGEKQ